MGNEKENKQHDIGLIEGGGGEEEEQAAFANPIHLMGAHQIKYEEDIEMAIEGENEGQHTTTAD